MHLLQFVNTPYQILSMNLEIEFKQFLRFDFVDFCD